MNKHVEIQLWLKRKEGDTGSSTANTKRNER